MKVAQYEVLGWRSEKATRLGRDDRELLILVKPHAKRPGAQLFYLLSSLAGRTYLLHHFPALRTGLLSLGPSGTDPSRRKFDGLMSKRIGGCRTESGRDPPRYEFQQQCFT